MTDVVIHLPDALVRQARTAGLLSDDAIQALLEDAIRRDAGRRLLTLAGHLHAATIPPLSDDALDAEVKAVRAQRRARVARRGAPRS